MKNVIQIPEEDKDKFKHIPWIITKERIYFTNKNWEKSIVEKMWDKCPKCGYENNYYRREYDGNIGTVIIIECPKCNHEEDITNYDLW